MRGSGIRLDSHSVLLCDSGQTKLLLNTPGLKEEFPREDYPSDIGTIQFGEPQRCKDVLEANRTSIILPA